jgi:predicted enzyme related to lactoylglutathione lyase
MSAAEQQETAGSTTPRNGEFVWYELRTPDATAAVAFYTHVVGWKAKDPGIPGGMPYTLLAMGEFDIAGVMTLGPEMVAGGVKPGWVGFVGVDDVDGYAARVVDAGGRLQFPPQDIPGVGRFASVEDPQGAAFLLFRGTLDVAPPRLEMGAVGTIGWHELSADDGDAAWIFYQKVFGWREHSLMDMGPMGSYRMFDNGGPRLGGMMTREPKNAPSPFWLYYFSVGDIDAAVARVREGGGQVLMGPHEVPGGQRIILGQDPQGILFSLVGS